MIGTSAGRDIEPGHDCALCPRLRDFALQNRIQFPDFHNGPVPDSLPANGLPSARLLIVGLAPGLKGANRTGVPFTGDHAGQMLMARLQTHGFAAKRNDGTLEFRDCVVTNAVRCVPPENRPTPLETNICRTFLQQRIQSMPSLKLILAIGKTAHEAVVRSFGMPIKAAPFAHGSLRQLGKIALLSSYHCSRYNFNTGVLTDAMLDAIFETANDWLTPRNNRSDSIELFL